MGPSYAGILGPLAFTLVLLRGMIDGSSPDGILSTAAASLAVFAAIGYVAGRVADQVLWDSVKKRLSDEMQQLEKAEAGQRAGAR